MCNYKAEGKYSDSPAANNDFIIIIAVEVQQACN